MRLRYFFFSLLIVDREIEIFIESNIAALTLRRMFLILYSIQSVQFVHPVEKISFISRDTTDRRAFGYIVEGEKNKFHFFGVKTGNAAEGLVLALRDLFQVVYDIKQKEKNQGKQSGSSTTYVHAASCHMIHMCRCGPVHWVLSSWRHYLYDNLGDQQQMDNLQQGINALNIDVTAEATDNVSVIIDWILVIDQFIGD